MRAHAPQVLTVYLEKVAREVNQAKKEGFHVHVDLEEDGTYTVPHEIDGPPLRSQIWEAADMITWFVDEDRLRASVAGGPVPQTKEVEGRLRAVSARGPDG